MILRSPFARYVSTIQMFCSTVCVVYHSVKYVAYYSLVFVMLGQWIFHWSYAVAISPPTSTVNPMWTAAHKWYQLVIQQLVTTTWFQHSRLSSVRGFQLGDNSGLWQTCDTSGLWQPGRAEDGDPDSGDDRADLELPGPDEASNTKVTLSFVNDVGVTVWLSIEFSGSDRQGLLALGEGATSLAASGCAMPSATEP